MISSPLDLRFLGVAVELDANVEANVENPGVSRVPVGPASLSFFFDFLGAFSLVTGTGDDALSLTEIGDGVETAGIELFGSEAFFLIAFALVGFVTGVESTGVEAGAGVGAGEDMIGAMGGMGE